METRPTDFGGCILREKVVGLETPMLVVYKEKTTVVIVELPSKLLVVVGDYDEVLLTVIDETGDATHDEENRATSV